MGRYAHALMMDDPRCDFEGCQEPVTATIRFELAEPSDPGQTLGTFQLAVCQTHSRPEFASETAPVRM